MTPGAEGPGLLVNTALSGFSLWILLSSLQSGGGVRGGTFSPAARSCGNLTQVCATEKVGPEG